MDIKNTILDDISAVIGFTATVRIVVWKGGEQLYVPVYVSDDHPLAKLIGTSAYAALVKAFAGDTLRLPSDVGVRRSEYVTRDQRFHSIELLMRRELEDARSIAEVVSLSMRRVQQITKELGERLGLEAPRRADRLPYVPTGNPRGRPRKSAVEKAPLESLPGNAPCKTPPGKPPKKGPPRNRVRTQDELDDVVRDCAEYDTRYEESRRVVAGAIFGRLGLSR